MNKSRKGTLLGEHLRNLIGFAFLPAIFLARLFLLWAMVMAMVLIAAYCRKSIVFASPRFIATARSCEEEDTGESSMKFGGFPYSNLTSERAVRAVARAIPVSYP